MTTPNTPLYGAPRPKTKPIPLSSSSIHSLSTELASLTRSLPTSTSTGARPRPSASIKRNKGVAIRARNDLRTAAAAVTAPQDAVSGAELERSRRKLREKAAVYERMRRGDVDDGEEALVDFDRKWAEQGEEGEKEEEDGDGDGELVEYEDEFGRSRMGTKEEARAAANDVEMRRGQVPLPPTDVIYGDVIQTQAFLTSRFSTVPTADGFAGAMPTEEEEALEAHYDASREVRTKGVGFYQFSTDGKRREEEMRELQEERMRTEKERGEKEERRKRRREEIEKRKEMVRNKRRGKVGESWLEKQFGGAVE